MSDLSARFSANPSAEPETDLPTVITQIEKSLRVSQQALLKRDLATFEQETGAQENLCGVLAGFPHDRISLDSEVHDACCRILHLGRVHLGLLRRAERSARVLSYLLASPGTGYANAAAGLPLTVNRIGSRQEG